MLHTSELIQKKRDGKSLSQAEIAALVAGISDQTVTDAQIAAFAMAVWFRGMDVAEQRALTLAMRDSGTSLLWPGLDGPVLDKHSTGGVGDLVSLVLGPMVAACGGYVPMISGRGLGHTGGTLDKLESIPGFNTRLDIETFQRQVAAHGIAIIGQTDNLAPADRRFYAVRDVTATVASVPLIVSSILSKKLAEGLDALIMDIKVGGGAFMEEMGDARQLALEICRVAVDAGVACNAVITNMQQPIAWSAGNALEVHEAISYLRGDARHPRMHDIVLELAAELLVLGALQPDTAAARIALQAALDSGAAAECFASMVSRQGGPVDLLDQPAAYLPDAGVVRPVFPARAGWVDEIDLKAIGLVVVQLGGGRLRAEDAVDHGVGIGRLCRPGTEVGTDTPLAMVHARNLADWERAEAAVRTAFSISSGPVLPDQAPAVWECITGGPVK